MMVIERISSTLKSGFGMSLKKPKELLFGVAKIYATGIGFGLVGLIVAILATYLLSFISILFLILGILLLFLIMIIGSGIFMSLYSFVDNVANNKKFKLIQTIKKDWLRNSVYVAVMMVLGIIVVGIPSLLFGLIPTILEVGMVKILNMPEIAGQFIFTGAKLLGYFGTYLIDGAWLFIIQFASWEYVVGRKGIVESIKSSYSTAMRNIWFVLGMDIIVGALMTIPWIIFYMLLIPIAFALVLLWASTEFPLLLITGIAIGSLVLALIAVIITIVVGALLSPVWYYTWKEAKKKKK